MPRFFVKPSQIEADKVVICGDDAHHISRSLRMAVGEHITVCDMSGFEYDCVLENFLVQSVEARILKTVKINSEPPYKAHLFQALPKGDKLDFVIQKSVECGVFDITPFESANCIVKSKDSTEKRKTERRQKIAFEAAKQCGRGIIPIVNDVISFGEMLKKALLSDVVIFCYEGEETQTLKSFLQNEKSLYGQKMSDIAIIIGSEGGFSQKEVLEAEALGIKTVGLGKRILRTETASAFVLSCLVYELEF